MPVPAMCRLWLRRSNVGRRAERCEKMFGIQSEIKTTRLHHSIRSQRRCVVDVLPLKIQSHYAELVSVESKEHQFLILHSFVCIFSALDTMIIWPFSSSFLVWLSPANSVAFHRETRPVSPGPSAVFAAPVGFLGLLRRSHSVQHPSLQSNTS